MKAAVIVALFAFVAVQLCQSAPMPDEEKKEETPTLPPITIPVGPVERSEAKDVKPDAPVAAEASPKPEEKKS